MEAKRVRAKELRSSVGAIGVVVVPVLVGFVGGARTNWEMQAGITPQASKP